MATKGTARRGRPLKFGQPARLLAVRLPESAVKALGRIHADPAWAILSLLDGVAPGSTTAQDVPVAELVKVGRRALILVDQAAVRAIPGVDILPLSGGRAFLVLQGGRGMSDLELAVTDRIQDEHLPDAERGPLKTLAAQLRDWRRSGKLAFETRSIIVAGQPRSTGARRTRSAGPGPRTGSRVRR